jgi:hypothetical protein
LFGARPLEGDAALTTPERQAEYVAGLQKIETAVRDMMAAEGSPITAASFQWHTNSVPPPHTMRLTVRAGKRSASAEFTREQIDDSHRRVDRPDVRHLLAGIVSTLTR